MPDATGPCDRAMTSLAAWLVIGVQGQLDRSAQVGRERATGAAGKPRSARRPVRPRLTHLACGYQSIDKARRIIGRDNETRLLIEEVHRARHLVRRYHEQTGSQSLVHHESPDFAD
jgi:hypothetical protein